MATTLSSWKILSLACFLVILEIDIILASETTKPNIVFILTDDQDVALFGQHPMPKTKKLITEQGTLFTNMFVTSPLCCPSRSSIFSGQFVHNHHAHNNSISGGCSNNTWQSVTEPNSFVTYLKAQGYQTFFAGKYLNQYGFSQTGGVEHVPPGWDDWHGLVGNSVYYNYVLSVNGKAEKHGHNYTADYLPDVIHRRGLNFLSKQTNADPFFMMLSTPSCHEPFTPAPQYANRYKNEKAPRTRSFNVHGKDKHWLVEQTITPMPHDVIDRVDNFYRQRHRTLLSVDDMVEGVYNKLKEMGVLHNTYIFFSSDNGYHLGQFSLPYDKRHLYDFDIRVPLIVRGPSVKANATSAENVMSIDLAPTFLDISGAKIPTQFDGMSLAPLLHHKKTDAAMDTEHEYESLPQIVQFSQRNAHPESLSSPSLSENESNAPFRTSVYYEYYGEGSKNPGCQLEDQGLYSCRKSFHCVCEDAWNNTYGCIRYETTKESYKFCEIQDRENFKEFYDMKKDPHELTNIIKTVSPDILAKLTLKLAKLSVCAGESCHDKSDLISE